MAAAPVRTIRSVLLPLFLALVLFRPGLSQEPTKPESPSPHGEPISNPGPSPPRGSPPAYYVQVFTTKCSGSRAEKEKCQSQAGLTFLIPPGEEGEVPDEIEPVARILGGTEASPQVSYIFPGGSLETRVTVSFPLSWGTYELHFIAETPADPEQPRSLQMELRKGSQSAVLMQSSIVLPARQASAFVAPPSGSSGLLVVLVIPLEPRFVDAAFPARKDDGKATAPRVTKKIAPVYPPRAEAGGRSGILVLFMIIDAQGKAHFRKFLDIPQNYEILAAAVYQAVKNWRFEPATVDG